MVGKFVVMMCINTAKSDYTLTSDTSSLETFGYVLRCSSSCTSISSIYLSLYYSGTAAFSNSDGRFDTTGGTSIKSSLAKTNTSDDTTDASAPTVTFHYTSISKATLAADFKLPNKDETYYYKCFSDFNRLTPISDLVYSNVETGLSTSTNSVTNALLGLTPTTPSTSPTTPSTSPSTPSTPSSSGTTTSDQTTEEEKDMRKIAEVSTLVALAIVAILAVIIALVKGIPLTSLWMVIDQIQMIILVMLVNNSTTLEFEKFLNRVGFIMVNFNFMKIQEIPYVEELTEWLDYGIVSKKLDNVGIKSQSHLFNNFSLAVILSVIVLIHIIFKTAVCFKDENHSNALVKYGTILRTKGRSFISNSVYMRFIMLTFMTVIFAAAISIREFRFSKTAMVLSHLSAWMLLTASAGFIGTLFFLYYFTRTDFDPNQKSFVKEIFSGLRNTKTSRLLPFVSTLRKLLNIVAVVFISMEGERTYALVLLISIQVVYLAFMILVRPFFLVFNNCLKIICESFQFIIMVYMAGMESESDWPKGAIKGFMAILIINAVAIIGIVTCFTVLHVVGLLSQGSAGNNIVAFALKIICGTYLISHFGFPTVGDYIEASRSILEFLYSLNLSFSA
ncbi:unnamed protein product [Moneuplotes crassus]|uniref:Uncharacterized protein n=1 Tax=Euplotes crassus TaxID=5936 RepID=A0AAD1U4H3_EUPCR|nr:unnamed protein product [Moneuplotes crassus]